MVGATLMKHYKNTNGEVFGFDDDQLHLVTPDMVEMTDAEFHDFCNPAPTPEQLLAQMKAEAQAYLDKTDHKLFADYVPKAGEDLTVIKTNRANARSFLRGEVTTWSAE